MTQIVSSISGLPIYAPSAAYAPTNSADVSAIASAYQVVSATAGDGTYVTSINGMGLSGQGGGGAQVVTSTGSSEYQGASYVSEINGSGISARFASLDSNGRDLGKLVDSASCSAIASSYAESAASGKLDSTAQVVSSTSSGSYITGGFFPAYAVNKINGSGILAVSSTSALSATYANTATRDSTGRLLSSLPDSATVSAIASAYQVVSSVGDDGTYITSINGSALSGAGGGGGGGSYVETSAMEVSIGSGNSATGTTAFVQGDGNKCGGRSFAQGTENYANGNSLAQGNLNTANSFSFSQGYRNSASQYSIAHGSACSAERFSMAQGEHVSALNSATVFGAYNLKGDGSTTSDSAMFVIGDGTDSTARHDLMVVTRDGEITMYSSTADTAGTGIMSSIRAISAAATGGGGVDSATVSAIASSYAESAVSSVSANYAQSADVSATVDLVTSQSANWGGSALQLSAGPGVSLTKSGNTLIAGIEGPRYNEETVAGYQNGDVVYQTIESGVFSSNTPTTVIGTRALYSGSRQAWIDVGQSYILYGNTNNILPISWILGTARLGSIGLIGGTRPCVFRGTDSSPTQCSAFVVVKYIK